nr:MAG TPA: hypothetical protein [Caudoviricetes sp.]
MLLQVIKKLFTSRKPRQSGLCAVYITRKIYLIMVRNKNAAGV